MFLRRTTLVHGRCFRISYNVVLTVRKQGPTDRYEELELASPFLDAIVYYLLQCQIIIFKLLILNKLQIENKFDIMLDYLASDF